MPLDQERKQEQLEQKNLFLEEIVQHYLRPMHIKKHEFEWNPNVVRMVEKYDEKYGEKKDTEPKFGDDIKFTSEISGPQIEYLMHHVFVQHIIVANILQTNYDQLYTYPEFIKFIENNEGMFEKFTKQYLHEKDMLLQRKNITVFDLYNFMSKFGFILNLKAIFPKKLSFLSQTPQKYSSNTVNLKEIQQGSQESKCLKCVELLDETHTKYLEMFDKKHCMNDTTCLPSIIDEFLLRVQLNSEFYRAKEALPEIKDFAQFSHTYYNYIYHLYQSAESTMCLAMLLKYFLHLNEFDCDDSNIENNQFIDEMYDVIEILYFNAINIHKIIKYNIDVNIKLLKEFNHLQICQEDRKPPIGETKFIIEIMSPIQEHFEKFANVLHLSENEEHEQIKHEMSIKFRTHLNKHLKEIRETKAKIEDFELLEKKLDKFIVQTLDFLIRNDLRKYLVYENSELLKGEN